MFTESELRHLLYCAAEELRARTNGKQPGPQPWLGKLVRRLELEVAVSSSRQSERSDESCSEHEGRIIGTRAAAAILGWTPKRVQRHAADLDGEMVSGKLMFRAATVLEYAGELNHARDPA